MPATCTQGNSPCKVPLLCLLPLPSSWAAMPAFSLLPQENTCLAVPAVTLSLYPLPAGRTRGVAVGLTVPVYSRVGVRLLGAGTAARMLLPAA